ncbi:MAG: hypothetical protein ABIH34_02545, partial [Nanoarchaeota archaeon]
LPIPPEDQLQSNPCTLYMTVQCDNTVYTQPEVEEIRLLFNVTVDQDYPGGAVDAKKDVIKNIKEKYDSDWWKTFDSLTSFIEQGQRFCYVRALLNAFGATIVNLLTLLTTILNSAGWLSVVLKPLTIGIEKLKGKLGDGIYGFLDNFLGGFCAIVTCDYEATLFSWLKLDTSPITSVISKIQNLGLPHGTLPTDSRLSLAKKSYTVSVVTLCLPGILYNLHKKRQAECFKAYCYEELILADWSYTQCDAQYNYFNCAANAGPFLETELHTILEWINPIDDIIEALSNPAALGWAGTKFLLKKGCFQGAVGSEVTKNLDKMGITGTLELASCIGFTLMNVFETYTMITKMLETMEEMKTPDKADFDYCDAIGI